MRQCSTVRVLLLLLLLGPVAGDVTLRDFEITVQPEAWQDAPNDLGVRLQVRVTAPEGSLSATVTDGFTTVTGQGAGNRFWFDVDGDATTPALVGRDWVVEVVVSDNQAVTERARLPLQVTPLETARYDDLASGDMQVPTAALPFFMGHTPTINAVNATQLQVPGAQSWHLYKAQFGPQITWELVQQFARGQEAIDLPQDGLYAIGVTGVAGGLWRLYSPALRANLTPPAQGGGVITVTGPQALQPTQLFASNLAGNRVLANGVLSAGTGFLDGQSIRQNRVAGYQLFGVVNDPAGYQGHLAERVEVKGAMTLPLLGVDTVAELGFQLQGSGAGAPILVTMMVDEEPIGSRTVWLQGNASGSFTWTPQKAGSHTFSLHWDRGDIRASTQETVAILDADAYELSKRSWYHPDRLLPAPFALPALIILAVLLHKRQIST